MLRRLTFLLAATSASALLPGRAPVLRRVAQPRFATPFLAAAEDDAAVPSATAKIAEALGKTGTTKAVPQSSNNVRNGAFVGLGVAALFFASKTAVGATVGTQLAYEVAHCTANKAKFFGFIGACCNWFLGLSALYDATQNGPENIALPMTLIMLAYSTVFCRWAGWAVMPRNFMLAGSHMLNIAAQSNQLRRCLGYKLETGGEAAKKEIVALGVKAAAAVAATTAFIMYSAPMKAMMPPGSFLASDAGPFSIHPWPPVTKFFLSLNSLTDLQKPTEKISLTQYAALTLTGFIFSFYGMFVKPINYTLTAVNILLFFSSAWHLGRKMKVCFFSGECEVEPLASKPGL